MSVQHNRENLCIDAYARGPRTRTYIGCILIIPVGFNEWELSVYAPRCSKGRQRFKSQQDAINAGRIIVSFSNGEMEWEPRHD